MADELRIAYLTSLYGRASDTFIRNEVTALRGSGLIVETFSIRRPAADHNISEAVRRVQESTCYLLERGVWRLVTTAVAWLACRPRRFVAALRLSLRTRPPGPGGLVMQLIYLCEAACLASELRRRRLHHIHNHIGENSATVAMLAAELAEVPYSLTIHGPGIFSAPRAWALGTKIERSAFTACISAYCRSQCMTYTSPACWEKLQIIRCGVDPVFLDQPLTPPPDTPRLVNIGRLCAEKGQLLLIAAMARLANVIPDVELSLIGDGPLRPLLHQRIEEFGLADRVHLLGWQSSDRVREEILASRALIVASFAEGLPVVVMEALALGRPVASTQIAGIPELVETGKSGWLFPAGDEDALVEAIQRVLTTRGQELARMGQVGAERVRTQHNVAIESARLAAAFVRAAADAKTHAPTRPKG